MIAIFGANSASFDDDWLVALKWRGDDKCGDAACEAHHVTWLQRDTADRDVCCIDANSTRSREDFDDALTTEILNADMPATHRRHRKCHVTLRRVASDHDGPAWRDFKTPHPSHAFKTDGKR